MENVELQLEAFDYLQLPFAIKEGICPNFPQRLSNLPMYMIPVEVLHILCTQISA